MNYPYADRNLFEEPENYTFAACRSRQFFDSWSEHRQKMRERLSYVETNVPIVEAHLLKRVGNGIPLLDILTAIRLDKPLNTLAAVEPKAIIDAIAQKFEIFRRLFDAYQEDLRREPTAREASVAEYVLFGHALADAAKRYDGPKFLSTLLKLTDALCSLPLEVFSGETAGAFAELLDREATLVLDWSKRVDDDAIA
jgi:hypothetical protein